MTNEEIHQLSQLLRKLATERLGVPRLPKEIFEALKGVVAQPAVEVLVTSNGRDVLLTRREDQHWHGYHLPGGFVGCGESLEAACDRIARAELGVGAKMERLVGHCTWMDHPYASAISLLCLCRLEGSPRDGQFFDRLPPDLLAQQRNLLRDFWPSR